MTDDIDISRGRPHPVRAGGCTVHTGRTLHYTAGNTTDRLGTVSIHGNIVNYPSLLSSQPYMRRLY